LFWQPFAARIVGIDRKDEFLKSLRLARVGSRVCRGVSYTKAPQNRKYDRWAPQFACGENAWQEVR
jgi:hypothetical protein